MKKIYLFTLLILGCALPCFSQQDCCDAQPLLGPLDVTIASNNGGGAAENVSQCSCINTNEQDSYWFSFQCTASGTFEMMITPDNLGADFDFAVFSGACPCNGSTLASCDYTGPINPPGPFVPTGISSTPNVTFGVPGNTEFQPTINITAGTTYYILANNITDNGTGFTIEFAGSAQFGPPPIGPGVTPPAPLIGSPTACPGASLDYSVPNQANVTYNWSLSPATGTISGNGNNTVNVTFDATGVYTLCVEAEASCETSSPTCIPITVNDIITVPVSDIICLGENYVGPNGQTYFGPGVYPMTFNSYQGCDSIVDLILLPAAPAYTVLVEEICEGDCFTFFNETYCQSGLYEEVLQTWQGCDSTVALNLIAVPNDAVITGGGSISCNGAPVILDGSSSAGGNNLTYSWTNSSGTVVGTGPTYTATTPGDYTLTINSSVNGNTCTAQETATVTAANDPPQNVTATGGVLSCAASSVILTGSSSSPNVTYAWTGPGGFTSNQQNPSVSSTGTYTLTVTGANGCTATATATVTGDSNLPNASATGGTLTCTNNSISISGNSTTAGVTYGWTGPGGFTSNQQNPNVSAPGTYTLTVTAANGCSAQATALVDEDNMEPDASATGGMLDCQSTSLSLAGSSTTPNVTFAWAGPNGFSSNQQNPNVSEAGTYTLTVTAANGCTATATAEVTQDANMPDATASGGMLDCDSITIVLLGNSTTAGVGFAWTGPNGFNSNAQNPSVSEPGTYVLTVTAANGCSATASATVTEDVAQPDASASGGTLTCTTGSVSLTGGSNTPNVTFTWSGPGGFSSNQQNPSVSQAGTYILTVTSANGCMATASATVMQDAGVPDVSADGGTIDCNVADVQLSGNSNTPGVTFAWTGPNGFTSNQNNPTVSEAGNYVLTVTAANNCTAQATAVVILDNEPPDVTALGGNLTCTETSVTLESSTGANVTTLEWSGPGGFSSNDPNPAVTEPGDYTLVVTGTNGCTASSVATVTADASLPDANASGGTIDCNNPEFLLSGSSSATGVSYSWSGPGGFVSNEQDTVVGQAGDYVLTVTAANGCTATATATVLEDIQTPNVNATGGILSCGTTSISLTGTSTTAGVLWSWTGPGGFSSDEQNPIATNTGNYILTVTAPNGCTANDNATVAQDANAPNVTATGGTLTCLQNSLQLQGNSTTQNVDYAWTGPGGFTSNQQNPTVTELGDYELTVTAVNGCSSTAFATVVADIAEPDATATGGTLTCLAGTLSISGGSTTPGAVFEWTGPGGFTSSDQSPTVSAAGDYILTVTGTNGCTASAIATVSADSNTPDIAVQGGEITCLVTDITLEGSSTTSGVSFAWTGPGGFTSDQASPSVSTAGTYTLTVTAPNGCTALEDAFVTEDVEQPDATATGGLITCQDPVLTLEGNSATPGVSYAWAGPGGFTSSQANPDVNEGGIYTLTVTAANGCTATATADVELDSDVPTASAVGGTLTCTVDSVLLQGNSNQTDVTWAWTGPGGFTSSDQNPSITAPGNYTLTVTTPSGCSASANAPVDEQVDLPEVSIEQADLLTCTTTTITLDASASSSGSGFDYEWTTADGNILLGSDTPTPDVDQAGTYSLTVFNQNNGCSNSAAVEVLPSADAPNASSVQSSDPICFGSNDGFLLVETVEGGTPPYQYSIDNEPFGNNSLFSGLGAGTYTLTIVDNAGCEWTDEFTIAEPSEVTVSLATVGLDSQLLVLGNSVTLKATVFPDTIENITWTPSEIAVDCETCTELTVTPLETATYSIMVSDENGCSASDEITVVVDKRRPVFVPNAFSPNNDGFNDFLTIFGGESVMLVKQFALFSRWGETVYSFFNFPPNDPNLGWNGTHRGKQLDPGVFTWFAEVEFIDGETLIFEGDVMLVR